MTATMLTFHIILVGTLAAHCICEDAPACNANDSGDDTCQFLQGPVGVAVIGRSAEQHATATKDNDVQAESEPEIAVEVAKEEHALATKHSDVHAKSGEHDEGWPGDLLNKFKDIFRAGVGLEKEMKELQKEWEKFVKYVETSMADIAHGKGMSLARRQAKVKDTLMQVQDGILRFVKQLAKVHKTYKDGVGKALPGTADAVFESAFARAEKDGASFAMAFQQAAQKIGAANTTEICARCAGALHEIETKSQEFLEGALGMSLSDFKKKAKDILSKLPQQARDEVDKFLKEASATGENMVDSLPNVVKEVKDGVSKVFKAQCPGLDGRSGADRSVGFSALLLGIAMWLA